MRKSSTYKRDLDEKEIELLKKKYEVDYFGRRFDGFLNRNSRDLLLHKANWKEGSNDQDKYDFYYQIRERAKAALTDFRLLCDVLDESQLKVIFAEDDTIKRLKKYQGPKPIRKSTEYHPLTHFLSGLIPGQIRNPHQSVKANSTANQAWRDDVLEEITIKSLMWYLRSGRVKSWHQRRSLADVMEIIVEITGSGRKIVRDSFDIHSGDDMID